MVPGALATLLLATLDLQNQNPGEKAQLASAAAKCLAALSGKNSTELSALVPMAQEYARSFEPCAFFNGTVANWAAGCGAVVKAMVGEVQWPVCSAAAECRSAVRVPGALHGACYARCKNVDGANGTVSTTRRSIAGAFGLTHPRICWDQLPLDAVLNYMGPWDLVLNLLTVLVSAVVDSATRLFAGKIFKAGYLGHCDFLRYVWHSFVVVHITVYAISTLREAGHLCRFMVLATPALFAPFNFSFSQVVTGGLLQLFLRYRMGVLEFSSWAQLIEFLLAVSLSVLFSVAFLLFFLPLTLASFWGSVAYPHIFLLLLAFWSLPYVVWSLVKFCERYVGRLWTRGQPECEYDKALEIEVAEQLEYRIKYDIIPVHMLAQLVVPFLGALTLVFAATFSLYFTGDWWALHHAFFAGLRLPPLVLPNLHLLAWPAHCWQAVLRLLSMRISLSMPDIYTLALGGQAIFMALAALEKVGLQPLRAAGSAIRGLCQRPAASSHIAYLQAADGTSA